MLEEFYRTRKVYSLTAFIINTPILPPRALFMNQAQRLQMRQHAPHIAPARKIVRVDADQARSLFARGRGNFGAAAQLARSGGVGDEAPDGIDVGGRGEEHPFAARDGVQRGRGEDFFGRALPHERELSHEAGGRAGFYLGLRHCQRAAQVIQDGLARFREASDIVVQRPVAGAGVRDPDPWPNRRGGRRERWESRQEVRD